MLISGLANHCILLGGYALRLHPTSFIVDLFEYSAHCCFDDVSVETDTDI